MSVALESSHKNRWSLCVFYTILLSYAAVFTAIAVWQDNKFLAGYESGDLTIFEQVIYNTLHGRPFYSTGDGQNHFGVHNSPILALLIPFAAIVPVPYLLYCATAISIVVSAIPIYLIVQEELGDETLAMILGVAYIMLPAFVGQVFQSFHEINLVLPFLAFAFYYFVKERFYAFLTMLVAGLMVKEDVSITLFMFAVYAIIKKRDIKWYLLPAIINVAWFLLSIKVFVPFFNNTHHYPMISYLSDLGTSFSEIVMNILSHPVGTFHRLLLPDNLIYLYVLLLPVGLFLPFLNPIILFVIPSLFLNLLVETSRFRLVKCESFYGEVFFPRHMSLMPTVFLFISAIYSIKKISSLSTKQATPIRYAFCSILMIIISYNSGLILIGNLQQRPSYMASVESIKRVLSIIPLDATVRANNEIAAHLYDRKEVNPGGNIDTDYLISQGKFYAYKTVKGRQLEALNNYTEDVKTKDVLLFNNVGSPVNAIIAGRYDLVALERGIALFRRKEKE